MMWISLFFKVLFIFGWLHLLKQYVLYKMSQCNMLYQMFQHLCIIWVRHTSFKCRASKHKFVRIQRVCFRWFVSWLLAWYAWKLLNKSYPIRSWQTLKDLKQILSLAKLVLKQILSNCIFGWTQISNHWKKSQKMHHYIKRLNITFLVWPRIEDI
jgi:hypothetical protein